MKGYRIYDDSEEVSSTEVDYRKDVHVRMRWIVLSAISVVIILFLTLILSNLDYSISDIIGALFSMDRDSTIGKFIWNIDLPIAIGALIAGAGLSLSGCVMQCILRNPLASPYTLGLSNAAAFGAAFSIIFLTGGMVFNSVIGDYITPIVAFIATMIATGIIIVLTRVTKISSETMVLAGIAVSAIFSAGITLMQYIADPVQLSHIVSWMFGSVSFANWYWDAFLLAVLILIFVFFYYNRWNMNAMGAGDDVAKGLGVNTDRFLILGLIVASVMAAMVVCKFGVIAFVGLLGPHIARMVVGDDHRYLIPTSALFGALLLMVANLVANNILSPMILPVGLLTSLLGGPVFIYLLIRRWRS